MPMVATADAGNASSIDATSYAVIELVYGQNTNLSGNQLQIVIELGEGKLTWQQDRFAYHGSIADLKILQPLLVDFGFYELQLQQMEQAILPLLASAENDVILAYNMSNTNRGHWPRIYQTIETLYRLRLQFARLEPYLSAADPGEPVAARRVFNRLLSRARIEDRLIAFSDRLEVLEDLYEGAADRITDYRNYRKGSLLEIGIIILLLLEVLLLFVHQK